MIKRNITPTKSNYVELVDELSLAKEGHGLLEQKREVLILNLTTIAHSIREKRSTLDKTFMKIFNQLSLVRLESGSVALELLCSSISKNYVVDLIPHSIMGVTATKLNFVEQRSSAKSKIPIGITGTSPNFDSLYHMTQDIRPLMAEVAYLESAAWKLVAEIKKTQRRINALENFVIPDNQDTIKFIKEILEEKDRETLFQIKRIKQKKIKINNSKNRKVSDNDV